MSSTASPSTTLAAAIDEDRAVAVAVERHAKPTAAGDRGGRNARRMRRTARQIDVASVRAIAKSDDVEAQALEQARCRRRRRAVRHVDGEASAGERTRRGQQLLDMIQIRHRQGTGSSSMLPIGGPTAHPLVGHECLDARALRLRRTSRRGRRTP